MSAVVLVNDQESLVEEPDLGWSRPGAATLFRSGLSKAQTGNS